MTDEQKQAIANAFPNRFEEASLNIEIPKQEFKIFEDGIFAKSMDERWHVFVINEILYFARSWTNFCVYKVFTKQHNGNVLLTHMQVSRDENQYRGQGIEAEVISLKKLLQMYLKREDLYIDPRFELPLIKAAIEKYDPQNECKRSIGGNTAGITRHLYNAKTMNNPQAPARTIGWEEVINNIVSIPDNEPLTSLHLHNRKTNASTTFYFNKEVTMLLGQITRIKTE